MKVEIEINEELYNIINDYLYEMGREDKFNEFVIKAITGKFNRENRIFKSKVDCNGWIK